VGGLVVYAVVNTLVPAVLLRVTPAFDAPHAAEGAPPAADAGAGGAPAA
jgi:hypothetical protein